MAVRPGSETGAVVNVWAEGRLTQRSDRLATEEPLEIRMRLAGESRTVAVTMRTPGSDFELAVGFLFSEDVLARREQVVTISYCKDDDLPPDQLYNIVIVELDASERPNLTPLERHFSITSACGVCGKANLEAIALRGIEPIRGGSVVTAEVIASLPERLRAAQKTFASTGGLHAAGLFTVEGELVAAREDVGRHNAVDKLIGWALLEGRIPLHQHVLMVSGRLSFELAQKAVTARVPILCAVSAPSSLAVDVAEQFGVTLVGFVRDGRFNIYSGAERIETGALRSL